MAVTPEILKNFITGIENQIDHKVKAIRCDNGTEFKNKIMNEFCKMKGIRREFSVARTPQQNGIAERKNRTLIELSSLTTRPLYELFLGRKHALSFMRPFGCPVTILNTLDHLGKFDGKSEDGFFVGYSIDSKAFRVFNTRTRIVEENLHINFLENKPNVTGTGPNWMFDIDTLTMSMNYQLVFTGNQTNGNAGPKSSNDEVTDDTGKKNEAQDPAKEGEATNTDNTNRVKTVSSSVNAINSSFTTVDPRRERAQRNEFESVFGQDKDTNGNSTYKMFTPVNADGSSYENLGGSIPVNATTFPNDDFPTDPLMPDLKDTADLQVTGIFSGAYDDEDVGAEADLNNLETTMSVSPIPTTRIYKDHPKEQIIGDINSATQTRRMIKMSEEHAMVSYINKQRRTNHKDYQNCLFACFLSQIEPKKVIQALTDPSWIEAMQEELMQFKLQKVWTLVDLPKGKRAIGTKLVAQGYTQEEGIDYDEVFALVARIEAIRLLLAYASFMRFIVYQIDVKSAFLYGTIKEEVYVCQPPGFKDPQFQDKVYKVMQRDDGIFISQDKYVADILNKFDFSSVKTASTLIETNKALLKDEEAEDVDVHLYRSMIRSLIYLTTSRPDIMFAVCACARFQVTPKTSHLHAMKRIIRYIKGQSKLYLWYPRDSPFDLKAFSDSDYAGASLDRKSITGGVMDPKSNA
ncbi:putative ribonuclease H-like domain-containing protein [Tanacetum coccineum]